jgi:hypothetical protein
MSNKAQKGESSEFVTKLMGMMDVITLRSIELLLDCGLE